jgi:pimeloyl-ACP methyl ester carboxylesterase
MTRRKQFLALLFGFFLLSSTVLAQTAAAPAAKKSGPSFAVKVIGKGSPIIFIPGLSSSGDTWKSTVAHFQDHHECHVLTLAGFAGETPIQPPLLATVREDLAAYIQQKHLQKPVLVGHSLGGNIVIDLAEHHPDLAGPLVIVDSLPFYAGAWFQVKTVEEAAPMIAGMRSYMKAQTREQYEQFVRAGTAVKYMASSPDDVQTLIQWGLASDQATVADVMDEMLSTDLRPDLGRIKSPSLVLGSWAGLNAQMKITAAQVTDTFQKQYVNLQNMHFALAPNARHFIMWDDPKWFLQQLDNFLAKPVETVQDRGLSAQ